MHSHKERKLQSQDGNQVTWFLDLLVQGVALGHRGKTSQDQDTGSGMWVEDMGQAPYTCSLCFFFCMMGEQGTCTESMHNGCPVIMAFFFHLGEAGFMLDLVILFRLCTLPWEMKEEDQFLVGWENDPQ